MRNYDDKQMEREWYGDIASPPVGWTWFDRLCVFAFLCVVAYALVHRWLHWF